MKLLSFLVANVLFTIGSVTYAQEKSICPSMCESEKRQCHVQAEAQSKTDVNPMIRTEPERKTGESLSEYQTRKNADLHNLINERSNQCNKGLDQCLKSCLKDEQENQQKAEPAKPPFKDQLAH